MGRFAWYSVALTTAVTHIGDLHQACYNRSTVYVLQYYVLWFQLYWSNDVEMATIFRELSDHPSYLDYLDLLCWQRRLLGVCTFAQARQSLRHSIKISCAGWNGDFCNVYVISECCGVSALATTSLLCNHQCVVSMRQKMLPVRCNKIPQ